MVMIPDAKHYEAFGRIMYWYAAVEVGVKFCLAGMMQTKEHLAMMAFARAPAMSLVDSAKAIAPYALPEKFAGQMIGIANEFAGFNDIRMRVAHHIWRNGIRPGTIRATFYDTKSGKAVLRGHLEEEKDYTIEELVEVGERLRKLKARVTQFLKDADLEPVIDPNTENI